MPKSKKPSPNSKNVTKGRGGKKDIRGQSNPTPSDTRKLNTEEKYDEEIAAQMESMVDAVIREDESFTTAETTSQSPKYDENTNTAHFPSILSGASESEESDSTENFATADKKTYPTLRYIAIAAIAIILCVATIYSLGYMPTVLSTIYAAPQYISLSIFSGFNTLFMSLLYIKNLTLSIIGSGVSTIYTLIGTALVSTAHALNYTYASLSYTAYVIAQCVKAYAYYIAAACVAIPLAIWATNTLETNNATIKIQDFDKEKSSTIFSRLYNGFFSCSNTEITLKENTGKNTKEDQDIIDYPCL